MIVKIKKYILSVTIFALLFSSGCQNASVKDTTMQTKAPNESINLNTGKETSDFNEYPKEIDMNEDSYTVAIQIVILPGSHIANKQAYEEAINAITVPAINCKIDLQEVWISDLIDETSFSIANDYKVDLIHIGTTNRLDNAASKDMLLDLNDKNLLQNRGTQLITLFHDTLNYGNVHGKQLAIPATIYNAASSGFLYNKTMADQYGIDIPENGTIADLENALYAIHEADPAVYPYYVGGGTMNILSWLTCYETFGDESCAGAIMDIEHTSIENLYATDIFRDYCLKMYQWRKDGLIVSDISDAEIGQNYFLNNQSFVLSSTLDLHSMVKYFSTNHLEIGWCKTSEEYVTHQSATEYMWGIAANSKRPDKAMDMLNFIYSNPDVAQILNYGLEGIDYEYLSGQPGKIHLNQTYIPDFLVIGNDKDMVFPDTSNDTFINEALNTNATESKTVDYVFDDSECITQVNKIKSVITSYLPVLQNGLCESKEATLNKLDEFIGELQKAGIDDVIAENQKQLNTFLEQQGR